MVKNIKNVIFPLPGRLGIVRAQAAILIKNTPVIVPSTVLKIDIKNAFTRLSCWNTSLKLSRVISLGKNVTPSYTSWPYH